MSGITSGIRLAPLMVDIKADIKTFKDDMSKASVAGVAEAKKISKELSNVTKAGEKLSKAGTNLTKFVSVPLAGAAAVSAKLAIDFGDSMAKVSTIADTTKVPIEKLKSGIMDLSSETGLSAKELNEALYETISAGVDTASAVDFLGTATKAAKGGFTDTTTAVDGLTTVLNSYGLQATEADKIANQMLITQNKGKTTFGELASAVGKVTPVAAQLGIKTEELFSSLASTTAQGLDTAESVTALKAAMSNIIKPTTEAQKAAEALGIEFNVSTLQTKGWMPFLKDLNEDLKRSSPVYEELAGKYEVCTQRMAELENAGKKNSEEYKGLQEELKGLNSDLDSLAKASDSPIGAFATMFGSVEGLNSILMLTSENGMKLYNDTMEEMKTNTTALDDAFNKMDKTPGEEMRKALNDIKNIGIDIGDIIVPVIRDTLVEVKGLIKGFKNLSPTTKENIVKIGGLAMAFGPLLSVVGKTIKTYTTLKPILAGTSVAMNGVGAAASVAGKAVGTAAGSTGLGALTTGLGGAIGAAAPFALAIGGVGLAAYGVHKALSQDVVPGVDLFADKVEVTTESVKNSSNDIAGSFESTTTKISESTKEAVGAYVEMDDKAKEHINNLYYTSTTISEQIKNETSAKFNTMASQIIQGYKKQKEESTEALQSLFTNSKNITDAEQQQLLKKNTDFYTRKQSETQIYEKQINDILNKASSENRSLKDDEAKTILDIQSRMKENAVKALSQNEVEAKVILQRMKDYDGRITAEQAGEHIKQLNESRDKAVEAANDEYEKNVATIIRMRDESHTISADQADKLIEEAKRQKDGIIESAENTRIDAINKMKEMNKNLDEEVDTGTGEILTVWDKLKRWWSGWKPEKKTFEYYTSDIGGGGGGSRNNVMTKNATGTPSWRGGLTMVHDSPTNNDYGEIMDLPRGTRIYPHAVSMRMAERVAEIVAGNKEKESTGTTINFNGTYGFNSQVDIDYFMNQAALKLKGVR